MNGSMKNGLRAMFWKECRENGGWALLGALGLLFAIVYGVTARERYGFHPHPKGIEEFWSSFSSAMAFGCVLIASALGFLQILPEQRRDQWAFLVHRPVSTKMLFWGKALAGLTMYLLAALLPLIAVGVWAAAPGNMGAPFDARLLLPGTVSIFGGVAAYFGALLSAAWPARWYGGRALPALLGAAVAFTAPGIAVDLPGVMLPLAVFVVVFAVATWGAFGAGRSWVGKIALTLVFGVAFTALYVTAISVAGSAHDAWMRPAHTKPYDLYGISEAGQIVRAHYEEVPAPHGAVSLQWTSVHDLNGRSLPLPPSPDSSDYSRKYDQRALYEWPSTVGNLGGVYSYSDSRRYVRTIYTYQETFAPELAWYYVAGAHRFSLYGMRSHRSAGWFGAGGFAADAATTAPFPGEPILLPEYPQMNINVFAFSHDVYRLDAFDAKGRFLDIGERKMTRIFHTAADDPIVTVSSLRQSGFSGRDGFVLLTARGATVIDLGGASLFFAPWGKGESSKRTLVSLASISGKHIGQEKYFLQFSNWGEKWTRAVVIAAGGAVLQQATLADPFYDSYHHTSPGLGLLAPPAVLPMSLGDSDKTRADYYPVIAVSVATGLLWAALAWAIGVRCSASQKTRIWWAALCFLFGLPGLLTLLAMVPWPARLPCPQCGKKRVVNHERCEHCGAAFPPPARDGTEIREAPDQVSQAA